LYLTYSAYSLFRSPAHLRGALNTRQDTVLGPEVGVFTV